jgi:hypothetical protein
LSVNTLSASEATVLYPPSGAVYPSLVTYPGLSIYPHLTLSGPTSVKTISATNAEA